MANQESGSGTAADDLPATRVGARIRALRSSRRLSLSALAEQAGIGKGSLSELETGRRNPTLDTLYAVARPLGVPLAALLDDHDGATITSAEGERGGMVATRVRVLRGPATVTEVYLLRLAPGAVRSSPAHVDGVVEQVVVLAGTAVIEYGDQRARVVAGEHLAFPADRPHSYRAGEEPAEMVNVIVTPTSGAQA
ncbi:XRE family transcriptional regulator [Nocardioides sambongensis]|uniref:XRE family transcriptional regulator n=1 Tax=Nocardioides sambongensis TaxID=2589074 RepID=UPI001128B8CD|nr:XRE family transcriptional regulator [Nocardioides sambongensis]